MDWCKLNEIKLELLQEAFIKDASISLCFGKTLEESFQPNYEQTKIYFYYNAAGGTTKVVERELV